MTEPKLVKKTIVTANQDGLNQDPFITNSENKVKAQVDHPTYVTGLTPTVADTQLVLNAVKADIVDRAALEALVLGKTVKINKGISTLRDTFVSWAPQIQNAPGITEERIKELFFGIKGVYDGHADPAFTVLNSHPMASEVIYGHLAITLVVVNNKTLSSAMPEGAAGCDVYETFVEANWGNRKKMSHVGRLKNGKITSHYADDDAKKDVFFMLVYDVKAGVDGEAELSPKLKATVI